MIGSQDGRVFTGTHASAMNTEEIVGVIRSDNKSIYIVDEDSHFLGELIGPDKFELVWMEAQPTGFGAGHNIYARKK